MERELKLLVDREHVNRIRESPLFADSKHTDLTVTPLISTYYDTSEFAFRRCNASLRVRTQGDKTVQTIKIDGATSAGLYERDEFEMPVEGAAPDLSLFNDSIRADSDLGKLIRDERTATDPGRASSRRFAARCYRCARNRARKSSLRSTKARSKPKRIRHPSSPSKWN